MNKNKKFGTREWAEVNKNFLLGCEHDCLYCYARWNAFKRFKQLKNVEDWREPQIVMKKMNERPKKVKGRIMFPTQHDILPKYLSTTLNYLKKWLEPGNEVLIVSKPHFECIKRIVDELADYRDQIVFRFTIGSIHNDALAFWEPNAPSYDERLKALQYAFEHDWNTSISIEPMIDQDVIALVDSLLPFVNDSIWIGKVNYPDMRIDTSDFTDEGHARLTEMKVTTSDHFVWMLYEHYKDNKKVHWKESIKKVIGSPDEETG